MTDRMAVLNKIKTQHTTHDCPSCGAATYCAMEAGKSGNLCWCMTTVADKLFDYGVCVCHNCLNSSDKLDEDQK